MTILNILIYLLILFITIFFVYFANKLLNKLGLLITFIVMSTISFLLSFKYITLSTISLCSNSITYVTMFTSLYLLLEKTNKKEVKKIAQLNFIINIFTAIMLFLMTYHTQSLTDSISINMRNVFMNNQRILLVYPLIILITSYFIIFMYEKIKKLYEIPFITTVTTFMLVGLIEGIVSNLLIYGQILSFKIIIRLILSTYMIRLITTVIYSFVLAFMKKEGVTK